jgi:hypothetical protein
MTEAISTVGFVISNNRRLYVAVRMKEERMVEQMICMNVPYACPFIQKSNKNIKDKKSFIHVSS